MPARHARRALAVGGAAALAAAAAAAALAAPNEKPVVAHDAKGDVRSTLDLTRFSLARGSDGRLRASITLAAAWDGAALVASKGGPPGSICLKLWTHADPPDAPPDYLVCVTAAKDGTLRGTVLRERANQLPAAEGKAALSRPSERTVTMRFSQTVIRRPADVDVAAESTRPGCPRGSCIDTAPDAPKTGRLHLRKQATAG